MPEPVDPFLEGEELKVDVTWGKQEDGPRAGQLYIRVADNGIGMTLGAVQSFLTQIGKSYYRSDTYRREREILRFGDLYFNIDARQ